MGRRGNKGMMHGEEGKEAVCVCCGPTVIRHRLFAYPLC